MSMEDDLKILELEIFNILELAYRYANNYELAKVVVCMEALRQLEEDYSSVTKKNFVKPENIDRLNLIIADMKKKSNSNVQVLPNVNLKKSK